MHSQQRKTRTSLAYAQVSERIPTHRKFKATVGNMKLIEKRSCTMGKKGRGRRHILSRRLCRSAYLLLTSGKCYSAREVAEILRRRPGVPPTLNKDTVLRNAKDYGISINKPIHYDRKKPRQKLKDNCKRNRVAFCKAVAGRDWANVMFTDRKRFYLFYPGSKVQPAMWLLEGERQEAYMVSNPICLNVYLGITCHGPTACHFVAGTTGMTSKFKTKAGHISRSICSSEYYHVVHKTFLPCGDKLFHGRPWVLQQDGDRSHATAHDALATYLAEHPGSHISILKDWPPCSPDLSVIENYWGWLQTKVNKCGCTSVRGFKRCLLKLIRTTPMSLFRRYFNSIPNRLQECIHKGGSRVHY